MKVRTYYWQRLRSQHWYDPRRYVSPHLFFRTGNAGDLFARILIEKLYGCGVVSDRCVGRRLLMVGSISHIALSGDLLCGIGSKAGVVPSPSKAAVETWGLRGPLTLDAMRAAGHDVSGVRFLYDPGLLIGQFLGKELDRYEAKGVAFIPHYRERNLLDGRMPAGVRLVDIDDDPLNVGRAILGAELVLSSSLHGIIFSHALGRPCVLVRPLTHEPRFKYEDYYASVGLACPQPKDLNSIDFATTPISAPDLTINWSDFTFPTVDDLRTRGILVDDETSV